MRKALIVLCGVAAIVLTVATVPAVATTSAPSISAPPALPPPPALTVVPPPPSGSYPDFVFVADAANANYMTIDLGLAQTGAWNVPNTTGTGIYDPEQWVVVFYFNNMTVPAGKWIKFKNHPSRAAVAFLAYDSITIQGTIDISGETYGYASSANGATGEPGPGGFRGGRSPIDASLAHAGFGPGGAFSRTEFHYPRAGSHATAGSSETTPAPLPGPVYGNVPITQLIGGSGGSSPYSSTFAGGPGGGAILLAANRVIGIPVGGGLYATCGYSGNFWPYSYGAGGSVRILADTVDVAGTINAASNGPGGDGRIRIERNNFGGIPGGVTPLVPNSIITGNAQNSVLFETVNRPVLRILSVGGQPAPLDPRAGVLGTEPADLFSPGPGLADVVIEGRFIPLSAPVFLRATAVSGVTEGEITVTAPPVGDDLVWTRTVSVDFGGGYTCLQARAVLP